MASVIAILHLYWILSNFPFEWFIIRFIKNDIAIVQVRSNKRLIDPKEMLLFLSVLIIFLKNSITLVTFTHLTLYVLPKCFTEGDKATLLLLKVRYSNVGSLAFSEKDNFWVCLFWSGLNCYFQWKTQLFINSESLFKVAWETCL